MKRVIITGGQGYLATHLASTFAQHGWSVLTPSREEMDVTSRFSVQQYLEQNPDYEWLIHSAGVYRDSMMMKMRECDWDAVVDTHLKGAFLCAQAAYPHFRDRGSGHLLFLGSHSAHFPPLGQVHYASAKAGLEGLARSLAREWGEDQIRVNVVLPGFHRHPKTEAAWRNGESVIMQKHALQRLTDCHDLAKFLLTVHDAPQLSGQVLAVDSRPVF